MKSVLAIDVGGTKIAVGAVDEDGNLRSKVVAPTPAHGGEDELFAAVKTLLGQVPSSTAFSACGIGCGGPMTGNGERVSPLNIPGWRDFALRASIEEITGLPTVLDNDAKAIALAEGWVGAAAGSSNFIGMVVSTGVGGGIVLNGRLLDGADGNAGHIGHVVVNPGGNQPPGQTPGTLEAECSGTSIAYWSGRPAAEASPEIVERTGRLVGRAVGSVANLLDLELAVVGGSVALGFGDPFFVAAQAEIDEICRLEYSRQTRIVPAAKSHDSPLIGAGALAYRSMGRTLGAILPPA